jgi:hypothetical protein
MKKAIISLERLEFDVMQNEIKQKKNKIKIITIDDYFKVSIIKRSGIICNEN